VNTGSMCAFPETSQNVFKQNLVTKT